MRPYNNDAKYLTYGMICITFEIEEKKMRKIIVSLFCICLFVSCEINVDVVFDYKTFNTQRQLWQASNVKNYKYHLRAEGFSGYSETIIVENGEYKESSSLYDNTQYFIDYSTIDEIYKTIENRFRETNNKKQPMNDVYLNEISVKYDKINHIPTEIHYKYHYPVFPPIAVDGTFDYYISDFEMIN